MPLSRLLAGALLPFALVATACGERSEPVGALAAPYPVTVQGTGGRPTVLDKRAQRIVALDPGSAELLGALGAADRLVGVPAGARVPGTEEAERVVSKTGEIDLDRTLALEPDLVVASQAADQLDVGRIARATAAAVYLQPTASIRNVEEGAVDLGFLVGEPAKGRALAGKIQGSVARIQDRLASVAPVSVFVDTGFFITAPDRSLLGDLVKHAKGASVAGSSPGPGPYPLADLRRADPEVFLATSDSDATLHSLKANPVTAGIQAVEDKRVVVLPAALVTHAGPRVAAALERIARVLHPDAFD